MYCLERIERQKGMKMFLEAKFVQKNGPFLIDASIKKYMHFDYSYSVADKDT